MKADYNGVDAGVLGALLLASKMKHRTRPVVPVEVASTGPVKIEIVSLSSSAPAVRIASGSSRNEPCPCRSGKKFKRCCGLQIKTAPKAIPSSEERCLMREDLDEAFAKEKVKGAGPQTGSDKKE